MEDDHTEESSDGTLGRGDDHRLAQSKNEKKAQALPELTSRFRDFPPTSQYNHN